MGSIMLAMAFELLRKHKDAEGPTRLQVLKETCGRRAGRLSRVCTS